MDVVSSQYQAPTTGLVLRSAKDRSTCALSWIDWLKVTMIGMPTPTVSPGDMSSEEVNASWARTCGTDRAFMPSPTGLAPAGSARCVHG